MVFTRYSSSPVTEFFSLVLVPGFAEIIMAVFIEVIYDFFFPFSSYFRIQMYKISSQFTTFYTNLFRPKLRVDVFNLKQMFFSYCSIFSEQVLKNNDKLKWNRSGARLLFKQNIISDILHHFFAINFPFHQIPLNIFKIYCGFLWQLTIRNVLQFNHLDYYLNFLIIIFIVI